MKQSRTYSSGFAQCETQDISPMKKQPSPIQQKTHHFPSQSQLTTQSQSKKPSRTQQQIYSHDLISAIMNKRLNYTVKHKVGEFKSDLQLYSTPKTQQNFGMMEFSDQKHMYQSEYTKRVNDIHKRLNNGKRLSERVKDKREQSLDASLCKSKIKRPASAGQSTNNSDPVHNKISVSGLVSYNFNSVNARKNLGFDFQHDQQKLQNILTKLQSRNKCCSTRHQSFMQKKHKHKATKVQQIKQAIFSDFETMTGKFLNNLHEQIQEEGMVYGVKWSKLLCIKEMMEKQKIGYHEAQAIVEEIQAKKEQVKLKKEENKLQRNDQLQLQMRKQVIRKNKVMVKTLYFAD